MGVIRVPISPETGRPVLRRWPFAAAAVALLVHDALLLSVSSGFGVLAVPAAAMIAAPVLWAWYRPLPAWAAMVVAHVALLGLGLALDSPLVPEPWLFDQMLSQAPVMYVLALSSPRRVTVPAFALTLAAVLPVTTLLNLEPDRLARGLLSWALALLVATLLGHTRRMRLLHTLRVAEELGRRRILEERSRIARELHDVVAHHMSVIAVQAASAPYRIEGGVSEAAAREFGEINVAARESLRDMRHLLGALRGAGTHPGTTPQPGLGELGGLVESVRRAGVPVKLKIGTQEPSPVVSLTAYRIVQEALSNVVRHAPGARTTVTISGGDGELTVEVVNEPPAAPAATPGSGLGLIGMRERVAALGGRLTAAATGEGGFAVRAVLPEGDE
ncbi:Signal transduction histidine kinase [Nonomuraea solani]|uniref:histidine kinase n=1 Tax=Nonomuraea solani TaxID=1144553 RepID=A0A1H6E2U9_9ACTN|nr:histidine kinase [Nonomuraea solani]SEG91629.1 Signal transduction histidine kinase [Nonomuraea solani]